MSANNGDSIHVLGLTGGIASGKSAATQYLRTLGAKILDADEVSRALTSQSGAALPAIREAFGDDVFDGDELNRRKLGALVFANEAKRRKLEGLIHPMVQQHILDEMHRFADAGVASCVLDVPLLYETGMDVLCEEVWLMAVPEETQIERITVRDELTVEDALNRIHSQMPLEEKQARADRIIWTDRSLQATQKEINALWQQWQKKISRK